MTLLGSSLIWSGCALRGAGANQPVNRQGANEGHTGSLGSIGAAHHVLAGFALNMQALRNSQPYRRLVTEQCSIVVAENAMKWAPLRPAPDRYFFDDADELVSFAEQHHIKVRGHNLCWHRQLPAWFTSVATRANARQLLTGHIRTVAGRYAGRLHSWDVVNEAVHLEDGRPDSLRITPWLSLVGDDYIELAFRQAREADPRALLTYNDYGLEEETPEHSRKRSAILLLLRRLRQRNVPVDAMGIQSHIRAGASHRYGPGLRNFMQGCRDLGLEVFLTEMDVDDRELMPETASRDQAVAATYRRYLEEALGAPNVRAVLTWGVDDGHTWLDQESPREDGLPQRPLLFDRDLRPKLAFTEVCSAFRARA